jgi:beta-glucosidase
LVLLKNDGTLPLAEGTKILLTGPGCRSLPSLHGPWSYTSQGADPVAYPGHLKTLLEAFEEARPVDEILFSPGTGFDYEVDFDRAIRTAQRVDAIVCVLAECPSTGGAGNISDLALPAAQAELVKALSFGKPLIVVLLTNRPQLITEVDGLANAVLFASYPGPFGGQAIHDVLSGAVNPGGKLPFTYPREPHALLTYDHKASDAANEGDFNPLYPFGHGLSYTTFAYENLALANAELEQFDSLDISVDVSNTGDRAGHEVVQVYVRDLHASITPPVRRLRAFRKIHLDPGQKETVTFSIPLLELAFFGARNKPILEPGKFEVHVGDQVAEFVMR